MAKAYIKYREERTKERNWNNKMMRAAEEKLTGTKIDNQNANVDEHSFGGRRGEFDSVISKQYALDNCMSKMARENNGFNTRQTDVRPANSINTAFQLVAVLFQLQSLQQFGRLKTAC